MQTQLQPRTSTSAKSAFNPHLHTSASVREMPTRFRVIKDYEGFRLNQVVYQYTGPTYGVEGPNEVPVTVTPHVGPFVGLTEDYLERVNG
jgi:hypothetical protein